jgi:ribose transport system substrate-binding protein
MDRLARPRPVSQKSNLIRVAATAAALLPVMTGAAFAQDIVEKAKAVLESGYKGNFEPPPSSGPKAVPGKTVWMLSCGQAYAACAREAKAFADAGAELGWKVEIKDGKADPAAATEVIRQGVAAKVDGIAVAAFDCPGIKSALLQAKQQKIPVVGWASGDCSDPAFGGQEQLFTASINILGSTNANDEFEKMGEQRAYYIIAKTNGKANIISINETSQIIQRHNTIGFQNIIKQCSGCQLHVTDFTFSQVPNPGTQIWKSAFLKEPKANVFEYGIDALMILGLQTAVEQSGRKDVLVGGGEGFPANFDLIRKGIQTFSVMAPYDWAGYGLADTLNRLFAGADPKSLPSEGIGYQYIDKDHNLPAPGEFAEPSIDFKSAYTRIWKG